MTTQPTLTPAAFAAKWRGVTTTEKAASQEHFLDLCRMLGEAPSDDHAVAGSLRQAIRGAVGERTWL